MNSRTLLESEFYFFQIGDLVAYLKVHFSKTLKLLFPYPASED